VGIVILAVWSGNGGPLLGSLVAVALGLVVTLLLAALVARLWLWRRTTAVAPFVDAAARVQDGDYSARVPETGSAEQRLLARAFNQMSQRLGESDAQRRSFMADVSHELRTPLTVIQGQLEAIRDGVYPADAAHIAPALGQVRTLESLVDDLRTLALSDSGSLRLVRQPADLGALVTEVIESFRQSADHAGVRLSVVVSAGLAPTPIDPGRIASVIRNLVANSLRHTPAGGTIEVTVAAGAGATGAVVSVRDTGQGIDPAILPTIFERFTRSADSTGSGLGLAIAKAIVEVHGGAIEARSEPGVGTTITVRLPAA
jgi:two-component system, OmpR family, sensor histidine kinase BaeS